MKLQDIETKVQNGVNWLNKYHPDWLEKIDIKQFSFAGDGNCVLGQLFGSFNKVDDIFGTKFCVEHGFGCNEEREYMDDGHIYNEIWLKYLVKTVNPSKEYVKPGRYICQENMGSFNKGDVVIVLRKLCGGYGLSSEADLKMMRNFMILEDRLDLYMNVDIELTPEIPE